MGDKDQFPTFRKYVARYGIWTRLRCEILDVVKRKREDDRRRAGAYTAVPGAHHQKFFDAANVTRSPKKGMDLFKTVQEGARGFQSTVEKTVKQTVEGARGVVRSVDRSASAPSVTASERRITTSPPPPPPPTPEETSITGRSSPSSIQSEDDGFADRGDN